jgi:hypothetical protein
MVTVSFFFQIERRVDLDMFGNIIVFAFQSIFHVEMHHNDFLFLKKLFLKSAHQNNSKY